MPVPRHEQMIGPTGPEVPHVCGWHSANPTLPLKEGRWQTRDLAFLNMCSEKPAPHMSTALCHGFQRALGPTRA